MANKILLRSKKERVTDTKLCLALDTTDISFAEDIIRKTKDYIDYVKIGMEFFYGLGFDAYEKIHSFGIPIFLDLKLNDIPNTVYKSLQALMKRISNPKIINVHASGGEKMMRMARNAIPDDVYAIAVTILTSLDEESARKAGFFVYKGGVRRAALKMASLAKKSGLDGVVCSAYDVPKIKKRLGKQFMTIVPGIRPLDTESHDQMRLSTPSRARELGADVIVVGRPITESDDPVAALKDIWDEINISFWVKEIYSAISNISGEHLDEIRGDLVREIQKYTFKEEIFIDKTVYIAANFLKQRTARRNIGDMKRIQHKKNDKEETCAYHFEVFESLLHETGSKYINRQKDLYNYFVEDYIKRSSQLA